MWSTKTLDVLSGLLKAEQFVQHRFYFPAHLKDARAQQLHLVAEKITAYFLGFEKRNPFPVDGDGNQHKVMIA